MSQPPIRMKPEGIREPLEDGFLERTRDIGVSASLSPVPSSEGYREQAFEKQLDLDFDWTGARSANHFKLVVAVFLVGVAVAFVWAPLWFLAGLVLVWGYGARYVMSKHRSTIRVTRECLVLSRFEASQEPTRAWPMRSNSRVFVEYKRERNRPAYRLLLDDQEGPPQMIHEFYSHQVPNRLATIINGYLNSVT